MKPLNILIGFEESGVVREAFRKLGHNAWSCDLQPARDGSPYHMQCDIFTAMAVHDNFFVPHDRWDGMVLHPECTALTVAGNHVYAEGKPKYNERLEAIKFTADVYTYATEVCDHVAMENPQGVLHTSLPWLPKPQYIQPHQFGDDASKKTGLTLHNLPRLIPTEQVPGRIVEWPRGSGKMVERWSNQCDSGQNILGPSATRARDRSETYPGIADAFAEQWGKYIMEMTT